MDEANITYFATDYLKEFSQSTLVVVVTPQRHDGALRYAVWRSLEEPGISSMVSVSLKDYDWRAPKPKESLPMGDGLLPGCRKDFFAAART